MMNESDDDLLSRFYMQNTAPVPAGRSYASAGSQPNAPASLASNPSGEKPNRVPLGALDLDDRNRTHAHVTHATDAKCTKLLADAESRILDERSKHQREMALREDLLKEKSRSDPAFQQNVQNLLSAFRQEAEKSAAGQYNNTAGAIQNDAKTRGGNDAADRVARLEALLAEKEQAIAAQEKRHQSERKELLALRTSQLKLESSKKGMEGELVNRAMATIAEYEAAVRQSETENSQRLSDYMDQFTRGWLNRAKDFEDNKARFEAETLDKAFMILREQETDVAKKEEGMRQHMVEILTQQSEARMDQEQRLLGQFERFKFEYKELQDRDFAKRCELFDQAHEKREQQLLERLSREREKLIQAEQQYSNAVEIQRVQCLNEAMEQVSAMRDQLLSDNQKKQEELHRQLLKQRDVMHAEMVESERQKAEHVAVMQQKVMEAMTEAHNIVASMKSQVVESEAEIHEKYMKLMLERSAALEADQQAFKDRIESGYFERVAGLNAEHGAEMKRLHDDMLMKQHSEAAEALEREQELRLSFTSRLAQCEEQVQKKYLRKLQEASDTETALQQTIQALKNEIQELLAQIKEREVLHQNREMHGEAKLLEVQRTSEAARLASEDEMRERYEKWLDDALRNGQKHSVDRMEVERMQREVAAADQRCLDLIRREREAMAGEKQHFQETCEKRIADERKRLENLEADLLDKVAGLRVELEAEMKRKEASNQRLFENERRTLYEEATERSIEERREKQAFEERVKEVEEARWKAVHVELQESCDARVRQMEAKVREREAYLDKKEAELRQHRLDHQQKVSADRARMDSDEWEARQRLEADLRKEAESRLADERARLQAELDTIRRHASEQQRSLDASRAEVQRNLQEQKLKLEQDAQAKLESMLQQAAADNREALQQTEAAFKKREKGMRQTHEKTVATMEEMHGREMHDVQDRLDHAMASIQSDKAEYEQALKAQFREREEAIRMETGARIKAEQEALRQRELQMARDNDRFRLEVEAAAREGVQQLFESRAAQLDHSEEERKKQLTGSFAKLLDKMQELDRDVQSRQREFEEDLRAKAEKALAQQREAHETATTGEMAALRAECNDLRMQLQKQRQLASLEDSTKFEARLSEQRKQADTAREKERKSAQEGADRLVAEADRRADNRIHDVTREYESQLTTLKQQLGADKDRHQVDLLRKDEEAAKQQEALSQQLHLKMDTLLTELKAVYERKWRHIQEQELERAAAADKRKIEFEAMTRSNYDRLLKEAEQAHAQALEKRETHRAAADKERDRAVAQLRQELDMTRLNEADEIEARVRERVADLSRQALEEKAEYMRMAETERDKREAAEGSVAGLQMEIDRLSSSMTQWKLELHKSLVSKYENLFNEVQSRARKDREAFARKLLEEEERRLARELVRKDAELTRSRNESERLASSEAETREQRVRQLERHQHMKRLFEAFGSRREKLLKLWALIDTDPTERMQLMNAMFSQLGKLTVPTSPSPDVSPNRLPPDDLSNHLIEVVTKVYEEVCSEIQRLEAQLPLMDIITRREFVKHRVSEVAAAGPSNLRDRQIADLRRELHKLNEQLLHDLPQYEQEHNAKLFYKNQRYLLVMEQDMQREQQQQMAGTGVPFPS